MIVTVTMNPSIDKTVAVDKFTYGGINRITHSRTDAGGKGINVAIAYNQLGGNPFCTGFCYREKSEPITNLLKEKKIDFDFVKVEGETRTNHKIYDKSKHTITELNESGHLVEANHIEKLIDKIITYCHRASILVLSGSVPKGVPRDIYKDILKRVSHLPLKTLLDAEGDLMEEGLKGSPSIIKPNLFEFEKAIGHKVSSYKEIAKSCGVFLDMGIETVGVSLGHKGAVIVNHGHAYYAPALKIEAKGTTGAGDSMVAGFCLAHGEKLDLKEMLRYGMAAATASVMREGTLMCKGESFERLLPIVTIESIY